jgi:hypothetical protein
MVFTGNFANRTTARRSKSNGQRTSGGSAGLSTSSDMRVGADIFLRVPDWRLDSAGGVAIISAFP